MLLEQVQTPQNTPNVIQPWRYPFKTLNTCDTLLPAGLQKFSHLLCQHKKEKPQIAKVNSRKYLNLTYSTIQKWKRSRTAPVLCRFELCISHVFKEDFYVSRKAPQCAAFISAASVGFSAERQHKMPPNPQEGRKGPNRGGDAPRTRR